MFLEVLLFTVTTSAFCAVCFCYELSICSQKLQEAERMFSKALKDFCMCEEGNKSFFLLTAFLVILKSWQFLTLFHEVFDQLWAHA